MVSFVKYSNKTSVDGFPWESCSFGLLNISTLHMLPTGPLHRSLFSLLQLITVKKAYCYHLVASAAITRTCLCYI